MRRGRDSRNSCKTRIGLSELRLRRPLAVSERPRVVIYRLLIPFPQDDKASADAVRKTIGPFLPALRAVLQSSDKFDEYSFRKYMHDFGRAYQNQAMELIAISRLFSQVAQQVLTQDTELTK